MEMGPNICSFPVVEVMATMVHLTLNPYAWIPCIMHTFLSFIDDFERSTTQILLVHISKNEVLFKLGICKLANLHNVFHTYVALVHTFRLSYHLNFYVNYIILNVI
jgi:hypothetical protein